METEFVPLADAPRILREDYKIEISYRKLYGFVLDGRVSAQKDPQSGRWMIPREKLIFIKGALNWGKPLKVEK
jgi:hypothetical protein